MRRELMDIMIGRHCCKCHEETFPLENGAIQMNRPALEGAATWEVYLHRHFWNEVFEGRAGINPRKLFVC